MTEAGDTLKKRFNQSGLQPKAASRVGQSLNDGFVAE
jgi:hypothetical protein